MRSRSRRSYRSRRSISAEMQVAEEIAREMAEEMAPGMGLSVEDVYPIVLEEVLEVLRTEAPSPAGPAPVEGVQDITGMSIEDQVRFIFQSVLMKMSESELKSKLGVSKAQVERAWSNFQERGVGGSRPVKSRTSRSRRPLSHFSGSRSRSRSQRYR